MRARPATPRTDTRERILDIAERRMMREGYLALTFHDVAEELGVQTPAIHYHFRSKADLGEAVVVRYGAKFDAWAEAVTPLRPAARLEAYLDVGRQVVASGRTCALGLINAQLGALPEAIGAAAIAVQTRVLSFYTDNLAAARAAGDVHFTGDPADKAAQVAVTLVGAQQMSRAFGPTTYDRVVSQLRADLGLAS
jgi:TetR/AcrR family transcriptional repressor of nem operon